MARQMLSLNSKVQAVVKLHTNLNTGIDPGWDNLIGAGSGSRVSGAGAG